MVGLAVVIFGVIAIASTYVGIRILLSLFRKREDPPIPAARDVNPGIAQRVEGKVGRGLLTMGKAVAFTVGGFLIVWPWLIMYVISSFSSDSHSMSKGRVLRIKSRAQLPQPATGVGWCGDAVALEATLSAGEREVLGELWLLTARMEHASIAAFSQLSLQLAALGAPAELLAWCHRAALEEIGHARRCFAIASAITGASHRAGPIAELAAASTGSIDLTRLAIGSLIDGCLAEGVAADVAAHGASTAREPAIRDTLDVIAREAGGHAELAWAVLAWCLAEGDAGVQLAVHARVEALSRQLSPRLPDIAGIDDATLARHGVVGQDVLGAIAAARCGEVQARARLLLAPVAVRRAA